MTVCTWRKEKSDKIVFFFEALKWWDVKYVYSLKTDLAACNLD